MGSVNAVDPPGIDVFLVLRGVGLKENVLQAPPAK
jgi:hypothetical protein